jgi:hypothetical protein
MAITQQGLTLEEFLALPEEKPALEYVAGAVRRKVSPEILHGLLQTMLCTWINGFAMPSRMAVAVSELRTRFGGCVPRAGRGSVRLGTDPSGCPRAAAGPVGRAANGGRRDRLARPEPQAAS